MSTPSTDADTPTLKREDVWSYPRPPALEPVPQRLRIVWYPEAPEPLDELEKANKAGEPVTIADTTAGYRVLETSHPPTYYLPPDDVRIDLLSRSNQRQTMCEVCHSTRRRTMIPMVRSEPAQSCLSCPCVDSGKVAQPISTFIHLPDQ